MRQWKVACPAASPSFTPTRRKTASRTFNQVLGVTYLALGVLGFTPDLSSDGLFLGLISLNLGDSLFHLIVGGIAAYFGFALQYRNRSMGDVVRGR